MQMTYPTDTMTLAAAARARSLGLKAAWRRFLDDMIRGLATLPPSV